METNFLEYTYGVGTIPMEQKRSNVINTKLKLYILDISGVYTYAYTIRSFIALSIHN